MIQVRPSEARSQCRASMEFVKPGSGQQSLPEFDHSGCFLSERVGDLLWAEHVICNPYASETKGKAGWGEGEWQSGREESWRSHTTSPPAGSHLLIHSLGKQVIPNPLLLCQDQAGAEEGDEGCNSMLTIQEEKLSAGSDDAKQHPDSRPGCRVRTVWRRWLSPWLKRKYASKMFTNQSLTNSKETTKKPLSGFWRWLTLRHLLLQAGSGHPHLVTSDHLHTCQSAVESLQPRFMSSPLMLRNRCFLDDGELVMPSHKDRVVGRPFLETRLSPLELPATDSSQREGENDERDEDRASGSCHMLRAFHCHTGPELRLHFGEESDSDLEELLVEDEDDGGGEGTDTD
ncbi:uncharacterized protein LOC122878942 [Siniperca chuatsi]|uniref:uncharacterized protein LOC122878942 n=1 Tax=Siniperca chuatsi TaxID=119488 RepID=UPI001CE0A599|nr:uncharacterized protein LOC122878942 [Siniperca chuatsi]